MGYHYGNRMTLFLFAALAPFFAAEARAAGEVALVRASSVLMVNDSLRSDSAASTDTTEVQNAGFLILIKNIAYAKVVTVWIKNDTAWDTLPAGWLRQADPEYEFWECRKSWSGAYGPSVGAPRDLEFKIRYIEGIHTYWDDNGGRNFKLAMNGGTLLGSGNVHFRKAQWERDTGLAADTSVFSGQAEVKGWKAGDALRIFYTPDNLKTLGGFIVNDAPVPTWKGASALPDSEKVYRYDFRIAGIRIPYSKAPTLHFSFVYADTTGKAWKDNNRDNSYAIALGEKLEDMVYEDLPLPAALVDPLRGRAARNALRARTRDGSSPIFDAGSLGRFDGIGRSR
jgi:hypothetical protein